MVSKIKQPITKIDLCRRRATDPETPETLYVCRLLCQPTTKYGAGLDDLHFIIQRQVPMYMKMQPYLPDFEPRLWLARLRCRCFMRALDYCRIGMIFDMHVQAVMSLSTQPIKCDCGRKYSEAATASCNMDIISTAQTAMKSCRTLRFPNLSQTLDWRSLTLGRYVWWWLRQALAWS